MYVFVCLLLLCYNTDCIQLWEEKVYFMLHSQVTHTRLLREVRAGTPTGPEAETMEYHCLLAWSPWLLLSHLSIQPRTSYPRVAPPTSTSHQDSSPHEHRSDLDNPSTESRPSLVTLGRVRLTVRTNREKTNVWTRQRVHSYRLYTSVSVCCLACLASPICFSFEPFGNAIACQPSKAPSHLPAPSGNVGL